MDYSETLEELFHHDRLARKAEHRLLASKDRKGLGRALRAAVANGLQSNDPEAEQRLVRLAELLARAQTGETTQSLFEVLRDGGPRARQSAADALIEVGLARFDLLARTVRGALSESLPMPVLEDLALVLGELEADVTVDLLLEMLGHEDARVVVAALEVAGGLGWDRRIWKRLARLTEDGRAVTIDDEEEGRVTLSISELATEVVETLRTLGRTDDE